MVSFDKIAMLSTVRVEPTDQYNVMVSEPLTNTFTIVGLSGAAIRNIRGVKYRGSTVTVTAEDTFVRWADKRVLYLSKIPRRKMSNQYHRIFMANSRKNIFQCTLRNYSIIVQYAAYACKMYIDVVYSYYLRANFCP